MVVSNPVVFHGGRRGFHHIPPVCHEQVSRMTFVHLSARFSVAIGLFLLRSLFVLSSYLLLLFTLGPQPPNVRDSLSLFRGTPCSNRLSSHPLVSIFDGHVALVSL